MKQTQEPKYDVNIDGQLFSRASGDPIPDDEPVFIFRARDRRAVKALIGYLDDLPNGQHADAVEARIVDFRRYAEKHPERMKEPDTVSSNA